VATEKNAKSAKEDTKVIPMVDTGIRLRDVFSSNNNKPFLAVTPGGNWGDYLIYWGAEALARDCGVAWKTIRYEDFDPSSVAKGEVVYLHGSGGFNSWCSGRAAKALLQALRSSADTIIQGPATYDNANNYTSSFLATLSGLVAGKQVVLFAREGPSLKLLSDNAPSEVIVGSDDDTAFHVRRRDFIQRAGVRERQYDLCCVREDKEAAANTDPRCGGIRLDPASFGRSFDHWLRLHAGAKTIRTDRTHSAIAGAILGVPTTLFGGAYHKNRSVWERSLRARGVEWGEAEDWVRQDAPSMFQYLRRRAARSASVQKLKFRYFGVPTS